MNELYERPKCEHNTCAITGASAFFCGIKDSVIVVNGSGFCFRKMLNVIEQSFRKSFKKKVFCAELKENSIIYGNEKELLAVLNEVKAKCRPSVLFIQNNCAGSLIGDDVKSIAKTIGFECPVIALDTGGIRGTFNDGYRMAAKAFFEEMPMESAIPESASVNIVGVTRAYYNFSEDCKELKKLLELLGIKVNSFVSEELTVEQAKQLGKAALNIVVHPELGGELAVLLEKRYHIPFVELAPPYGLMGSKYWLTEICHRLEKEQELLDRLEQAFKPLLQEERYYLNYFRKRYGDIWIKEINLVGPKSVVKALAHTLRREYVNYETMNLFSYEKFEEVEKERFYCYQEGFDVKKVHMQESCFLFGSYYEHVALKKTQKAEHLGYVCIANPNFNYINLSPLMGIGGSKRIIEELWQYYIDYSMVEFKSILSEV